MRVEEELAHRLRAALQPKVLQVVDESALHAGHAGARPHGQTHFRLMIVSERFAGLGRVARQRLVYEAAGSLMGDPIHALAMQALTTEEASPDRVPPAAAPPAGRSSGG